MIKVVIFDLWNTLIPATIDWPHLISLVKKSSINNEESSSLGDFIKKYEELTQKKKYGDYEELRKDFLSGFSAKGVVLEQMLYEIYVNRIDKIVFFDDVLPTLVELKNKGYKLALLTNTENLTFEKIEAKLKLSNYFDFLGLSYEIGEIKPNPKMFEAVVNHFGVKPSECLMVGDSLRSDITGAKNFGIPSVWINRPKKSFDFAEIKPDFELSTLRDIDKVLEGLGNG
ncbi:MAG: HAD family hydrolase [Candidatus Iainarchaeum sp.]|jgi:2-haloalkanoic acid dehalogenase type II